jgi:1-acyl-sn-glycerol-3-phosphate acyltransferase
VEFIGLENLPPRGVLAPDHQSLLDIIVLASLPTGIRWISKKEVASIPFLGWALRASGCYFVKRDRSGGDLNVMREVEEGLQKGELVLIFPEGTRTRTGELLPLKKGAFKTATNAHVPVCPIAVSGTYEIAPPGKLLPVKWGHRVIVRIGHPMPLDPKLPLADSMEQFRQNLQRLLEQNRALTTLSV